MTKTKERKEELKALKEERVKFDKKSGSFKWADDEVELLRELIAEGITSAKFICSKKLFSDRSMNAIKCKINEVRAEDL